MKTRKAIKNSHISNSTSDKPGMLFSNLEEDTVFNFWKAIA